MIFYHHHHFCYWKRHHRDTSGTVTNKTLEITEVIMSISEEIEFNTELLFTVIYQHIDYRIGGRGGRLARYSVKIHQEL